MRSSGWIWVLVLATVVALACAMPRQRGRLPAVDAVWNAPAAAPVPFPFNVVAARIRLATAALDRLP